jgi:hypothetical protein
VLELLEVEVEVVWVDVLELLEVELDVDELEDELLLLEDVLVDVLDEELVLEDVLLDVVVEDDVDELLDEEVEDVVLLDVVVPITHDFVAVPETVLVCGAARTIFWCVESSNWSPIGAVKVTDAVMVSLPTANAPLV